MKVEIALSGKKYLADLNSGIDISIPLHAEGPRAWYVNRMIIRPVVNEFFTGSVELGGSVNFREIIFNPHGHGTHTETFEHISKESLPIVEALQMHHFAALVVSITPNKPEETAEWMQEHDSIISVASFQPLEDKIKQVQALVIRTLPNGPDKKNRNYSNTNFPYLLPEAMQYLVDLGVQHLLVDLPSVDREEDGGLLKAHHIFWDNGSEKRKRCTITEFVYVEDHVRDGFYLLNLQIAPFVNDAAPSRPILFPLMEKSD